MASQTVRPEEGAQGAVPSDAEPNVPAMYDLLPSASIGMATDQIYRQSRQETTSGTMHPDGNDGLSAVMNQLSSASIATGGEDTHMRALVDVAQHLCTKYGTAGLSAGLLDHGKVAHVNIGTLDLPGADARPTSPDSMYLISSMTKPIFALAVAIMVNDGRYAIKFTTEVRDVFPELAPRTFLRHAGRELTLVDLLDNRTEFPKFKNLWESPNGPILWKDSRPLLSALRHLPPNEAFQNPASFEHARNYSNEGFALAAAILEKKTGMPWAMFVRLKILEPLEMQNTIAGQTSSDTTRYAKQLAKSFTASIGVQVGKIQTIDHRFRDGDKLTFEYVRDDKMTEAQDRDQHKRAFEHVRDVVGEIPPLEVPPSQASRADDNRNSTLIGAAAGIVSSVSDLLKFYAKFIEVYHGQQKSPPDPSAPDPSALLEVERGMMAVQKHIRDMVADSNACAYAAGWNTAMVPGNPDEVPRPRWPGEDGDNVRWLNKAATMGQPGLDDSASAGWPFFRRHHADEEQRLVLHHGGNMIGATSFCLVDVERKRAVVVLTNTRGFVVDCANAVGMLMSTHGDAEFMQNCSKVKHLACVVAATYLRAVCQHERDVGDVDAISKFRETISYDCFAGTYELASGIFATVSVRQSGNPLVFQLYGSGYEYPLRMRRDRKTTAYMSIVASMSDLLPTGVGGNKWLGTNGFDLVFQRKEPAGYFEEFVWDFSMTGKTATDAVIRSLYTFKRVR
jgi:CubicO group peptidase (beta-lactamase class C family)